MRSLFKTARIRKGVSMQRSLSAQHDSARQGARKAHSKAVVRLLRHALTPASCTVPRNALRGTPRSVGGAAPPVLCAQAGEFVRRGSVAAGS